MKKIMQIIKFDLTEKSFMCIFVRNIPWAEFVTGAYYYWGLGDIKKDSKKAFEIIKRCADNGHIAAIYDLGANFYYNGNGTEMNKKLAEYYLKMAKDAGLKRAIEKYRQYEFGEER